MNLPALGALLALIIPPVAAAGGKPYADTAIGALLVANGGKIPATGAELVAALAKLGDFLQLAVPFSAVDTHSGLTHPRVVIAMRPSTHPAPASKPDGFLSGGGGWGGSTPPAPRPAPLAIAPAPSPLGRLDPNRPQLEGRLFLAANTELQAPGRPVVKSVEFLSWNTAALAFDFGVIEGLGGGTPVLKILDGARCFSCHKNRGPILGDAPWSNTTHNPSVRLAAKALLKFPRGSDETADGMAYLKPHAVEVDAAIREGAERLRDRAAIGRLARSETGRRILAQMLAATVARRPIGDDKAVRHELNRLDLVEFVRDEAAARKVAASDRLLDFNPVAGSVLRHDEARARGDAPAPRAHRPSNPKAFARPVATSPRHASEFLSVAALARAVGLSEGDREYLAAALDTTAKAAGAPVLAPAALAERIFAGPRFADVLGTGVLPDRDDFKDRFVAGLKDFADERGKANEFEYRFARAGYATAPVRDPNAHAAPARILFPSHACLACHDVRGAKPTGFNPIPPLAFDPFDVAARSEWLAATDRPQRVRALGHLVQRLSTDRDMPPDDSREADAFRGKDFDAVKDWLTAELKKAKGG